MNQNTTREPYWKRKGLNLPPTEPGATFTLADTGTDDAGKGVSAVEAAFADTWGEVALVLEDEFGQLQTYAILDGKPIHLSHVYDENYIPDEHGMQTNGIRLNYQFIRCLDATPFVAVVPWEQTLFTDVVAEEVWYP
jgi:hypothetical protein